jgi:hypothetical protein
MTGPIKATSAVIRVGDGRGFVIAHNHRMDIDGTKYVSHERYVITAAHCLLDARFAGAARPDERFAPHLPPCTAASFTEERTYKDLLAPLGHEPAVWAECLFVDPVGDIAVLGTPDNQTFGEQAEAYNALVEPATPLKIAAPGKEGWLLSLEGDWFRCAVQMIRLPHLMLAAMEGKFIGGMSGSPIVSPEGAAIGVACLGAESVGNRVEPVGPNPSLVGNLPGWLLRRS